MGTRPRGAGALLMSTLSFLAQMAACGGKTDEPRACTQPLNESECASTLAAQREHVVFPGICAHVGACGSYLVLTVPGGYSSVTCVYDASGQHLLSSTSCTDVSVFCDNTDSCIWGGQQIDIDQVCGAIELPVSCATGQTPTPTEEDPNAP